MTNLFRGVARPARTKTPGALTSVFLLPNGEDFTITDNENGTFDIQAGGNPLEAGLTAEAASIRMRFHHHASLLTRNSGAFNPESLGEVLSWTKGDDASNVMQGAGELPYTSLYDSGTMGGTFDSGANAAPVAVLVDGKQAPGFNGLRNFEHTAATTNFDRLHNGQDCSLSFRFYLHEITANTYLFDNKVGSNDIGIRIRIATSNIEVNIGDGTTGYSALMPGSVALGWNTFVMRKVAGFFEVSLNDGTPISATVISPSAGTAAYKPHLGNYISGANAANEIIAETVFHAVDIGTAGVTAMHNYFAERWSATPDASLAAVTGADIIQIADFDLGVTLGTGSEIASVRDQGGYGNTVSEATNRPAQVANDSDFTSNDSVDFDGTNDKLRIAAFTGGNMAEPFVLAVAGTWDFDTPSGPFIIGNSGGSNGIRHQAGFPTLAGTIGNKNATVAAPVSGTPFVIYCLFNGAASEIVFETDGAASSTDIVDSGGSTFNGIVLGATGTGSSFWSEKLSLAVIAEGVPDTSSKALIIQKLRDRAGVTPL